MGHRHQALLIARIKSINGASKYRCVALFHHHWCLGNLPLRAVYRFILLITRKENAAVVRGELGRLNEKYRADESLPSMPCPYATSLLGMAFTVDLDEPRYFSGISLKHGALFGVDKTWRLQNDDGYSVVDVTDPEYPKYCFLASKYASTKPLTAYEYMSTYENLPEAANCAIIRDQTSNLAFIGWCSRSSTAFRLT
ncbi:hypothetical protein C8Q76DRAFT_667026 [Earliella scabrosa]|nr:hypothetical protein C8Q76DRAFT_667026 [Earliella scabrosa]